MQKYFRQQSFRSFSPSFVLLAGLVLLHFPAAKSQSLVSTQVNPEPEQKIPKRRVRVIAPGFERFIERLLNRNQFTMLAPPLSYNSDSQDWVHDWMVDSTEEYRNIEGSIEIIFDRDRKDCLYTILFRGRHLEGEGFITYEDEITTGKRSRCKRFLRRSLMSYIPYL